MYFLGIKHGRFVVFSLAPMLVLFVVLTVFPTVAAIWMSFFNYNLMRPVHPFVGLANYRRMLDDAVFQKSLFNTIKFAALTLPLNIVLSLPIAIALNSIKRLKTFFRTAYFLPTVTSLVAISLIWLFLYDPVNGLINTVLGWFGLPSYAWLRDPRLALPAIVVAYVWQDLGYNIVVFLAALQGLPDFYYEAARIDGANFWHEFRYITLPLLKPVMGMVFILTIISAVKVFAPVQIMTGGGPMNSTRVLVFHIYETAFSLFRMGYASAMAVVLLIIILILTLIQRWLFRTDWEY
ncbi:MAG: sugar ABC transporter permease [Firmicutes bacterium]|nr:sugar ABC transporter permease [Bacillota bacterium]